MSRQKKKGFTLVELVVVLVIMTVILGIAIPSVLYYMKMAEFRKNEENAKTVYLAAESKLTYYRSSGQWEEFKDANPALPDGTAAERTDSCDRTDRKRKVHHTCGDDRAYKPEQRPAVRIRSESSWPLL